MGYWKERLLVDDGQAVSWRSRGGSEAVATVAVQTWNEIRAALNDGWIEITLHNGKWLRAG